MIKTLLLVAILGQFEDSLDKNVKVEPFPIRPEIKREILEASEEAAIWARMTMLNLNRVDGLERALRQSAYRQVCEAYSISPKEFNEICRDPKVQKTPFRRRRLPKPVDAEGKPGIAMRVRPNLPSRTLFDPSKVRIPDSLAKRCGYQNPPSREQAKAQANARPNVP